MKFTNTEAPCLMDKAQPPRNESLRLVKDDVADKTDMGVVIILALRLNEGELDRDPGTQLSVEHGVVTGSRVEADEDLTLSLADLGELKVVTAGTDDEAAGVDGRDFGELTTDLLGELRVRRRAELTVGEDRHGDDESEDDEAFDVLHRLPACGCAGDVSRWGHGAWLFTGFSKEVA